MNPHYLASLKLLLLVVTILGIAKFWLDLPLGFGIVIFLGTVAYTIYKDVQAARSLQ
ncbi:hypothetical protein JOD03_001320 [Chryseomicrobium aureum]|uniref:hypothetical protein n=1 Tax=Chryseomicrobium aureum TaxID=1441723 RepID=UPI0019571080|nr:hypothetical protein [Chryseomicrobium aureum]MBM7706417.1 hypothetical protein [Chryseomicrobium aureum]